MNPLLVPFKRKVEAFAIPSRPDLEVHLLRLTAGEALQYQDKLATVPEPNGSNDTERDRIFVSMCIATHVCDADGKLLLTQEEAQQFTFCIEREEQRALIKAAARLNGVNEAAIEAAEKN